METLGPARVIGGVANPLEIHSSHFLQCQIWSLWIKLYGRRLGPKVLLYAGTRPLGWSK